MGQIEGKFQSRRLFEQEDLIRKKHAAKEFLTMWCAAVVRNEAEEFEEMMATSATPSPSRGGKRRLEDTAVAAEEVCLAAADEDGAVAASLLTGDDAMIV